MLPPKNGKPITFKPTSELREQTEAIADSLNMSLSDYVRKAVESYNSNIVTRKLKPEPIEEFEVKQNKTEKPFKTFFK